MASLGIQQSTPTYVDIAEENIKNLSKELESLHLPTVTVVGTDGFWKGRTVTVISSGTPGTPNRIGSYQTAKNIETVSTIQKKAVVAFQDFFNKEFSDSVSNINIDKERKLSIVKNFDQIIKKCNELLKKLEADFQAQTKTI